MLLERSEMPKATDGNLWGFQLWVRQVPGVRQEGPLLVLVPRTGGLRCAAIKT